jgi:CO dehydrogenase/acetyl-CoA synthase beta subunit
MQRKPLRYLVMGCLLLFFVVGISSTTMAQRLQPGERMAQIQGLKIEFINRYLKLTQADSGFWRVYYPYVAEIKRTKLNNTDDVIEAEEKILAIRKKYQPEFRRILGSEERAQKVYTIDREFAKLVREEMQKRAGRRLQQE